MSENLSATGSCLCGAVTLEAKSISNKVGACHCSTCQKWSGGPVLALDCKDDVILRGEENISVYASSEWAERGFCLKCGTHLFYRMTQNNQHIIPAGIFNLDTELLFDHQIFIDEKPAYYSFSNKTKNMTGAEIFAEFSGE